MEQVEEDVEATQKKALDEDQGTEAVMERLINKAVTEA